MRESYGNLGAGSLGAGGLGAGSLGAGGLGAGGVGAGGGYGGYGGPVGGAGGFFPGGAGQKGPKPGYGAHGVRLGGLYPGYGGVLPGAGLGGAGLQPGLVKGPKPPKGEVFQVPKDMGLVVLDTGLVVLDTGLVVLDTGLVVLDTGLVVQDMGLVVQDTGLGVQDTGLGVLEPELQFLLECLSFPRRDCREESILLLQLLLLRKLQNCQVLACLACTKAASYQDKFPAEVREEQAQQEAVATVDQCNPGCSMDIRSKHPKCQVPMEQRKLLVAKFHMAMGASGPGEVAVFLVGKEVPGPTRGVGAGGISPAQAKAAKYVSIVQHTSWVMASDRCAVWLRVQCQVVYRELEVSTQDKPTPVRPTQDNSQGKPTQDKPTQDSSQGKEVTELVQRQLNTVFQGQGRSRVLG
ncbi:unnamed protein product [Boreogadus saida]